MTNFFRTFLALSLFMAAAPLVNHASAQVETPPPGACPPGEITLGDGYCYVYGPPASNPTLEAPEIHLSSSIGGIVLLFGGMMVLRGRKAQQQR